jgi:hypothetical protein
MVALTIVVDEPSAVIEMPIERHRSRSSRCGDYLRSTEVFRWSPSSDRSGPGRSGCRNVTRPTATFIASASVSSGATRLPNAPGTARIVTDLVTFTVVVLKVNRIENPRLAAGVDSRERRRQQAIWLLDCARG